MDDLPPIELTPAEADRIVFTDDAVMVPEWRRDAFARVPCRVRPVLSGSASA